MTTSADATYPTSLRVISLNCWGLKFLAKYRNERLAEIGVQLAKLEPPPEIVGLQECWTLEDYLAIRQRTKHILPYGKFYYSGIFGGGLAILSKWPIVESTMVRFPLNGRPTAFFRGDWYVGKGVACAKIQMGPGSRGIIEVFTTHFHAPYEKEPHDSYLCHRTAQAWEMAKLMHSAAEKGHLVLGLGDFNMIPMSLAYRLIEAHGAVRDVWRTIHPMSSLGAAEDLATKIQEMPTVDYNLAQNGTTCDSASNTWRWDKDRQSRLAKGELIEVDGITTDPRAKRLDYIFLGNGRGALSRWTPSSVNVGMTSRHPSLNCSLSDHFSVEATLVVRPEAPDSHAKESELDSDGSNQTSAFYNEIIAMIEIYTARERRQRRLRLAHFVVSVVVSIGCFIAIWWSPRNYVSFILILLSSLGLAAGVIDGLIGGLFVGSELRALKEFDWEIKTARDLAVQQTVE